MKSAVQHFTTLRPTTLVLLLQGLLTRLPARRYWQMSVWMEQYAPQTPQQEKVAQRAIAQRLEQIAAR